MKWCNWHICPIIKYFKIEKKKKKWDRQFLTYSLMHKLIGLLKYGIHWWIMLNLKIKYVQYTNSPLNNKQKWIIWTNEIIRLPVK